MRVLFWMLFLGLLLTPNFIQSQITTKEWTLESKKGGSTRVLKSDQKVTVYWQNISGLDITWGRLVDISEDSILLTTNRINKGIAKKDIREIRVKRQRSVLQKLVGFGLVLAGIFVFGFFLLIQGLSNISRPDYQLATGEQKTYWHWALVGVGMIVLGLIYLKSPNVRTSNPFGDKWIVQEVPATKHMIP